MCEEIAEILTDSERNALADRLLGVLLESNSQIELPVDLARSILYLERREMLGSKFGIKQLIKAGMYLEPEKTRDEINKIRSKRKMAIPS
jgi:hypothetical protein